MPSPATGISKNSERTGQLRLTAMRASEARSKSETPIKIRGMVKNERSRDWWKDFHLQMTSSSSEGCWPRTVSGQGTASESPTNFALGRIIWACRKSSDDFGEQPRAAIQLAFAAAIRNTTRWDIDRIRLPGVLMVVIGVHRLH